MADTMKDYNKVMEECGYNDSVATMQTILKLRHLENHYNQMRIDYILERKGKIISSLDEYYLKDTKSEERRRKIVTKFIEKREDIIKHERKKYKVEKGFFTAAEICLSRLDKEIMLEQLDKKGYSPEIIELVLKHLQSTYTVNKCCLVSCDLDDYDISEAGIPTLKPTNERFSQLLKKEYLADVEQGLKPTR